MRLPPQVAVECPASDMVNMLNRLEDMTWVRYCRLCFGVGQQCQCSVMPHQAPGTTMALWSPPVASYAAMASPTETITSTSTVGATTLRTGMPQLEPMETSPPLSTANLLLTTGVGRGARRQTPPRAPTAPGPHQSRLRAPPPQVPTPRGQGATASTPYEQQVTPPPGRALPHVPPGARVRRGRLAKKPDPGKGQHLEAPGTDNKPLGPQPEELVCGNQGSAAGQLPMTISKMRCQTMCPPDGGET